MDRLHKAAIITRLAQELREHGSWCGETHLQKAAYFLQELLQVPLEFQFILYKHGPFSFDLRDELAALQADELLRPEPHPPYGPKVATTERAQYIQGLYPKTVAKYERQIALVANRLGPADVATLERLATGLYVTKNAEGLEGPATVEARAKELHRLKPHVSVEEAQEAIGEVDKFVEQATAAAC